MPQIAGWLVQLVPGQPGLVGGRHLPAREYRRGKQGGKGQLNSPPAKPLEERGCHFPIILIKIPRFATNPTGLAMIFVY